MNSNEPHNRLYLGVNTHLELHVATLINEPGQIIKSKSFSVNLAGYRELLAWCKSYGYLQKAGIDVYEVMRPN